MHRVKFDEEKNKRTCSFIQHSRVAWLCLMDPSRGMRVTQIAYISLLTRTKKLLLLTFCDLTAETGVSFRTHRNGYGNGRIDGQTDVTVEIVI